MLPDNLQIPFTKNNFIYSSQQLDEIVVITILFYFQKKKKPKTEGQMIRQYFSNGHVQVIHLGPKLTLLDPKT